jgi:DNA-directed RNA polymerase specialized sigma24 family protein
MRSGPVWKPSADDQLMRAFGNGDEAALRELFIRFGPDMYGIGRRCFLDAELADAFVESTFITMWHRSSQYTSSSMPLETWVVSQALAVALQMSPSHPRRVCRRGLGATDQDRWWSARCGVSSHG